jgi:hypothetical protein
VLGDPAPTAFDRAGNFRESRELSS